MKKTLIMAIASLLISSSIFAETALDIDFGMSFYGAKNFTSVESKDYFGIKDLDLTGFGFYASPTFEFNKYFGIFAENSCSYILNTKASYDINSFLMNNFKINNSENNPDECTYRLAATELIGVCGIIPINDKFRIRLGAGFDCGVLGFTSDSTKEYEAAEMEFLYGIGTRLSAVVMISDLIGLNFGVSTDYYFGGTYFRWEKIKYRNEIGLKIYEEENETIGSYSTNFGFIRPEIGVTIRPRIHG